MILDYKNLLFLKIKKITLIKNLSQINSEKSNLIMQGVELNYFDRFDYLVFYVWFLSNLVRSKQSQKRITPLQYIGGAFVQGLNCRKKSDGIPLICKQKIN